MKQFNQQVRKYLSVIGASGEGAARILRAKQALSLDTVTWHQWPDEAPREAINAGLSIGIYLADELAGKLGYIFHEADGTTTVRTADWLADELREMLDSGAELAEAPTSLPYLQLLLDAFFRNTPVIRVLNADTLLLPEFIRQEVPPSDDLRSLLNLYTGFQTLGFAAYQYDRYWSNCWRILREPLKEYSQQDFYAVLPLLPENSGPLSPAATEGREDPQEQSALREPLPASRAPQFANAWSYQLFKKQAALLLDHKTGVSASQQFYRLMLLFSLSNYSRIDCHSSGVLQLTVFDVPFPECHPSLSIEKVSPRGVAFALTDTDHTLLFADEADLPRLLEETLDRWEALNGAVTVDNFVAATSGLLAAQRNKPWLHLLVHDRDTLWVRGVASCETGPQDLDDLSLEQWQELYLLTGWPYQGILQQAGHYFRVLRRIADDDNGRLLAVSKLSRASIEQACSRELRAAARARHQAAAAPESSPERATQLQGHKELPRRTIQQLVPSSGRFAPTLALANDRTGWMLYYDDNGDPYWERLPDLPSA